MEHKIFKATYWILGILPLVVLLFLLPNMPNQIPVHYDASGVVNRWGSKYESFLMPVITVVTAIGVCLLNRICVKKEKTVGNLKATAYTGFMVVLLFSVISFIFLYAEYNLVENISTIAFYRIFGVTLSIMFIVIGNIMPKSKRNKYIGIRIKWTLENDAVWAKTNRLTGILFVITGILGILISILFGGMASVFIVLLLIILTSIIGSIYAYKTYQKICK